MNDKIRISELLKDLGIAVHLSGYQYLKYAIELAIEDMTITERVTKELYPTIAKHFRKTAAQIERAIRHSIEVGWRYGDMDIQNDIFGSTVNSYKGKPTNGQFISTVADYLLTMED